MSNRHPTDKRYDKPYFRRWYYGSGSVAHPVTLGRRVRLAVAVAEYVLERPVRSVLDVGCGEGRWRSPLCRLRPGVTYVGVDPSEYVVRRYGRKRGIRRGTLGELGVLGLRRSFDLVVCSDFLEYVNAVEIRRGLAALRRLAGGVVYADVFTTDDEFEGDREGLHHRSRTLYRRWFADAGFIRCGLNCWVAEALRDRLTAFERAE